MCFYLQHPIQKPSAFSRGGYRSFRWLGHRLGHDPVTRLLRESCFHLLPIILIHLLLPVFFIPEFFIAVS